MLKKTLQSLVCFFGFYLFSLLCEYLGWGPAKVAFFFTYLFVVVALVFFIDGEAIVYTVGRQGEEHSVLEGVIIVFGSTIVIGALAAIPMLVSLLAHFMFDVDFFTSFALVMFCAFLCCAVNYIFKEDCKEFNRYEDEEFRWSKKPDDGEGQESQEQHTNNDEYSEWLISGLFARFFWSQILVIDTNWSLWYRFIR